MKPAWAQVKQALAGKVKTMEVESADPNISKVGQINGYPTIRLYPHGLAGGFVEHKGGRSAEELMNFATGQS